MRDWIDRRCEDVFYWLHCRAHRMASRLAAAPPDWLYAPSGWFDARRYDAQWRRLCRQGQANPAFCQQAYGRRGWYMRLWGRG